MDCVVAPFDHTLSVADEEVSVTDPPEQNVVGPDAEIVGVGKGFTVKFKVIVLSQPTVFSIIWVYTPLLV